MTAVATRETRTTPCRRGFGRSYPLLHPGLVYAFAMRRRGGTPGERPLDKGLSGHTGTFDRMRPNRRVSLATLSGIGVGLTGVLLFDIYEDWLVQGDALVSTVVENALPLVLLAGLFYAIRELQVDEADDRFANVVAKWTVIGTMTMALLTGWVVGIQTIQNELKPGIIVLQTTVAGAVAGMLVGRNTATVERTRNEVRREKERFESLFENDPSGIVDLRLDGDRLAVAAANPVFQRQFGATTGDTLAATLPETDEELLDELRRHTGRKERFTTETTHHTDEGEKRLC